MSLRFKEMKYCLIGVLIDSNILLKYLSLAGRADVLVSNQKRTEFPVKSAGSVCVTI
jgi:hypothetical protein